MKVLINATAAAPGAAGETYFSQILPALAGADSTKHYIVVLTERQRGLVVDLPSGIEAVFVTLPGRGVIRGLALQRTLRQIVRQKHADVLYNTGNFFTPQPGCRQICLIENANAFSRPTVRWTVRGRLRNRILRRMTESALRGADQVIFPSNDCLRLVSQLAEVRAPATVIYHGYRPPSPPNNTVALPPRFILCVSSIYPHKNLPRLVHGFRILRERHRYEGILVIVGFAGPRAHGQELERAIADNHENDRVMVLQPVPPEQLSQYYRAADLSVLPSIEESFGLPAVESMAHGCPVAAGDVGLAGHPSQFFNPFPEICGTAAEYFNPFDPADISTAMARALAPDRRAGLIEAGFERVRLFTWEEAATRLTAVINTAMASPLRDRAGTRA